jgi:uncharacterized membrane protein
MHPIHPMVVHFPIALLIVSVIFDLIAMRWRTKSFRDASFYTLIAGLIGAAAAVLTGAWAEEVAEGKGIPESVLEIHETLGYATLALFIGLLGLRLLMRRGVVREIPALYVTFGLIGVVVLLVTGYYGGVLVYDFGAGVNLPMSDSLP